MAPAVIYLYRAPFSTNVERVALALAHKGLEVEPVVIDYSDRSLVEEVSGQGLIPVIDDDGEVVADSTEILRYLEATYPDPPLFPAGRTRRAEMDVFLDWFNEAWKNAPNTIQMEMEMVGELEHEEADVQLIAAEGERMRSSLDLFESLLGERDFLMDDRVSVADFVAYPFLKYGAGRDPDDDELFHRILEKHLELGDDHPAVRAWLERIAALPQV
jgi:glutathione S-transferase